jgi:hypothetical protein
VAQKILKKPQSTVLQTMENIAKETVAVDKVEDTLEETRCQRVTVALNIEAAVDELQGILEQACRSSLTQTGSPGKALLHKPTPWWSTRLATQRKEVKAKKKKISTNEGEQRITRAEESSILSLKIG